MSQPVFVIVGASLAGAKAAEQLRTDGFEGRIVLFGEEPHRPYERPSLSKDYLRGEAEQPTWVHDSDYYAEHDIELRTGERVAEIDTGRSTLTLEEGEMLSFDSLLLATGARPRGLNVPGADLDGVLQLRTVDDSDALRARLHDSAAVAVVGAGWIGCEVAASARQMGCEVTIIEPQSVPLERVLGLEVGEYYRRVHTEHGVRLLARDSVAAIEVGARHTVRTTNGEAVECDLVAVGVGVQPRDELAVAAGLDVSNGILVDAGLRTSVPAIFAAGDVANLAHPFYGRRVRVEHWAWAGDQGAAAGQSMLGQDVSFGKIPYFYSDQYDVSMEYRGNTPEGFDEVVFRGDPGGGEFLVFWLKERIVQAAMNVNIWDQGDELEVLVAARTPVDVAQLRNEDAPLSAMA
jgi:3-phenylpropionate/trans-cinnamate dioxygenase ferredoxin reductase component